MGQYYRPVLNDGSKITIYNRNVDGEYTMAKLTEHSWWEVPLMKAISEKLYQKRCKLIWCGDYAENDEVQMTGLTIKDIWDCDGEDIESTNFNIDNLFLCNHETKEYVNLATYKQQSIDSGGWVLHPLSLLTAIGNERGGGDYYGINKDKVGIWAWSLISLEAEPPVGYTEFEIIFKEN